MICAACGSENRDAARFCGECAAPLVTPLACPACGGENPPGRRFCDGCAHPLGPTRDAAAKRDPRAYTRDLSPRIEEARAELARIRNDLASCERALREAARLHRENGQEFLATQAEAELAP